jgi:hypothetical protein
VSANGRPALGDLHLAELLGKLAEETSTLVRQEVQLAKVELLEKVDLIREDAARRGRLAGLGSAFVAGAALVGLVAVGLVAALLVALLDIALPLSAAVALVLALFAVGTAVLGVLGASRLRAAAGSSPRPDAWPPTPDQTIETLKEDVEWARHPRRSASRSSRPARA